MAIPDGAESRKLFQAVLDRFRTTASMAEIDGVVDKLDAIIGPALGLDAADIASIRGEMDSDPFLKNIVPRWPATETRIHGYRTGLDSSERYE
jgi:hypothetical protein